MIENTTAVDQIVARLEDAKAAYEKCLAEAKSQKELLGDGFNVLAWRQTLSNKYGRVNGLEQALEILDPEYPLTTIEKQKS